MRTSRLKFAAVLALPALWLACTPEPYPYEVYSTVDLDRPANPAVDAAGNVYITMHPLDAPSVHLMRIDTSGDIAPYPTAQWAASPDSTGRGIANTIGIQATEEGLLYVLDWGNADHGPKVLVWNTQQNQLHRVYNLPAHAHHGNSFLQDFAVDTERQFLYMADMGRGDLVGEQAPAIVALNLNTGEARRILENHDSFLPGEGGFKVNGNQMMLKTDEGDKPLNLGLNPICIDPANQWVYYSTVNPGTVYRVPAKLLADFEAPEASIADAIEAYGPKPASDGISVDGAGNVYITSLEENGVGVTSKDNYRLLFSDPELSWVDGMSYGPDGYFYAVVNQLHKAAPLNGGVDQGQRPYKIIRFKALAKGKVGR